MYVFAYVQYDGRACVYEANFEIFDFVLDKASFMSFSTFLVFLTLTLTCKKVKTGACTGI